MLVKVLADTQNNNEYPVFEDVELTELELEDYTHVVTKSLAQLVKELGWNFTVDGSLMKDGNIIPTEELYFLGQDFYHLTANLPVSYSYMEVGPLDNPWIVRAKNGNILGEGFASYEEAVAWISGPIDGLDVVNLNEE